MGGMNLKQFKIKVRAPDYSDQSGYLTIITFEGLTRKRMRVTICRLTTPLSPGLPSPIPLTPSPLPHNIKESNEN